MEILFTSPLPHRKLGQSLYAWRKSLSPAHRDYLAAVMARLGIKDVRYFVTRYVPLDV